MGINSSSCAAVIAAASLLQRIPSAGNQALPGGAQSSREMWGKAHRARSWRGFHERFEALRAPGGASFLSVALQLAECMGVPTPQLSTCSPKYLGHVHLAPALHGHMVEGKNGIKVGGHHREHPKCSFSSPFSV